ncbi:Male-specific lethal 3-like protein, partial [Stegodyphus mimosarum]
MFSTRGVKFKFSEGERVLCYEPDPTKAKVLYESKVLDLVVSHDGRGRKVPEYLIHFFGWNSSWDRCVKEEFILPFTEENRELQAKLAKDAALSMKGKRKSKLPPLIKETLAKKARPEGEPTEVKEPESPAHSSSESESSEEEMEREVTINIPDILKEQLEEDFNCITQKDKFVKLPCQPNVIDILEAYVKHLAANLLCASPPKNSKNGKQFMPEDVQSKLNLCKEAMDGIRVYFDFTLPHILLYRQEKKHFYTVGTTCAPISNIKKDAVKIEQKPSIKSENDDNNIVADNSLVTNKDLSSKTEIESSVQNRPQRARLSLRHQPVKGSQSPKAEVNGNLDLRPQIQLTTDKEKSLKKPTRGRPKNSCTRILRSSDKQKPVANEETNSNTEPPVQMKTDCSFAQSEPEPVLEPTNPLRITRKSIQNSPPQISNSTFIPPAVRPTASEKTVSNCSTSGHRYSQAPPSLSLASNCISSSNSSTHSTMSSPILEDQQYHLINNSGLLQEVLSWRMLPQQLYDQIPAAPSLIYGAQHLLRLFVKLPDFISKMSISQRKLEPLLNILDSFLLYMADQKDELFHPSAYIDSSVVFPRASTSTVK